MRTKQLLMMLVMSLLVPLGIIAQTLSPGDRKTGRLTATQQEAWYTIEVTQDGEASVTVTPLQNANLRQLHLYAVSGGENKELTWIWVDGGDGGTLTRSNLAPGTYKVRLTGYPKSNEADATYQISYTFTAPSHPTEAEPNNTWQTAVQLEDGKTQYAHLGYDFWESADIEDWYKIDVPADGTLTIELRSYGKLRVGYSSLYTVTNGETKERNSRWLDVADETLSWEINNVSAGTYYLRLPRYAEFGVYQVTYYFTTHSGEADPEPNDTWQQAVELKAGPAVTGQLGYDYQNTMDTEDWYKFEVPEEGTVTLSTRTEGARLLGYCSVYALVNGELKGRNNAWRDIADSTLVWSITNCAAGTYYLSLPRYAAQGTYSLQYTFTPCPYANDPEPNDTYAQAGELKDGVQVEGRIGYDYYDSRDNEDWYKFDVPEEGTVTLTTRTDGFRGLGYCTVYALVNGDVKGRNNAWRDIADSTLVWSITNCAAGTYYLRLPHYADHGGYTLKYDFTPCPYAADPEPNNVYTQASELMNGVTVQGRLGYDYYESRDDEDWYKFEVPADGSVSLTTRSEGFRLGLCSVYALVNGDVKGLNSKWLDIADSTLVWNIDNCAAGTYYLYLPRYADHGGYTVKYDYTKNPYYRQPMDNGTFAKRYKLEEGKAVYSTLGYSYYDDRNTEDWYDLGMMHGRQIDVTVEPDTSRQLNIGYRALYKYVGDNEDGTPQLQEVAGGWQERTVATLSYIDNGTEDSHYVFKLPIHGGGMETGGYKIVFGDEIVEGDSLSLAGTSPIKVMTGGRSSVRKGVPCENPITITNFSDQPTGFFMLAVEPTEDVHIIGFRMPVGGTEIYLPADSVTIPDDPMCLFFVPNLQPWESYTFTMISEGVGDIAYAPQRYEVQEANGQRRFVIMGTAVTVAAVGVFIKGAAISLAVGATVDWVSKKAGDAIFPADSEDAQNYARLMGQTTEQLGIRSSWDSPTVYTAKSVMGTAASEAMKKGIGASVKTGTVLDVVGNVITAMTNIIPNLRRRIWSWIYKDLGYYDNPAVLNGKKAINDVVSSWDPNEMCGPAGVGELGYISGDTQTMEYTIMFENKAEAGDAAYRVRISDELDENVFDVSSVKFGATSHDGVGYNWKMSREGGKLSWDIEGIELPPNVHAPEGEGYVTFSVDLKPGLADGTAIKNKATIIFDKNFPIETNEYVNTIDRTAPVTTMSRAGIDRELGGVAILCESTDSGSGVESYQLFVSKDGGDYEFEGKFFNTALYPVTEGDGSTYSFYVLATDAVGNTEVVIPTAVTFDNTTDIRILRMDDPSLAKKVYTMDGRYVGESVEGLSKGTYIVGGKKVIIR